MNGRAPDPVQLDLFPHSRDVVLANDVIAALVAARSSLRSVDPDLFDFYMARRNAGQPWPNRWEWVRFPA